MPFSRMLVVRQNFPDRRIPDVAAAVQMEMAASGFAGRLSAGSRVAIGVGSRGISNLPLIVRCVVEYWKANGMEPFIFPAMGTHGAATAEGQADVLASYGITEAAMGCPIVSSLEVGSLGRTPEGIETYLDRSAYEAAAIMLIARVKWHTDFAGRIESGLFKMMAIGLGKFAGAQRYHTFAYKLGLETVIRSVGRQILRSGKIAGGLAILEDAYHNTAQVTAVPVHLMEQTEEALLAKVKSWMGRLPCDLDILILDELGKDISGSGMDTKVINRGVYGEYNVWDTAPRIDRIFVRDLSERTYNNAVGIGLADVTTDRLVSRIDWAPTRVNALTANTLASIQTPVHFPSDRECLERVWPTVGKFEQEQATIGWIRNSLEIARLAVTENLRPQLEANPLLEIEGPALELPFDTAGNLVSVFGKVAAGPGN
jgi:hypothetical protein